MQLENLVSIGFIIMDNVVYNDAPHIYEAEGSGFLIKLEGTYIVELKYHLLFDASDEVHINALLSLNGKRNVLPSYKSVNYSTAMQKTGVMTFIAVLTEQDRIVYQFMGQKSYVFSSSVTHDNCIKVVKIK